ncbi:MAG: DUF1648 domain-containing protein [Candidatus Eisenbacteria bacterium]|nr:DUF1648 domain-containing protein [Candidatus Eisenbacteria bacterium]
MRDEATSRTILLLIAVLAAFQMIHYHPLMPERMAVHFGASGSPNGWSERTAFVVLFGSVEALIVLLGLGLPALIGRMPVNLINIPNRHYWFAEERRQETLGFLKTHVLWMETATLGFLMAVAQIIFSANANGAVRRLPANFWLIPVVFVGVIVWLSSKIVLRFRVQPAPGPRA